MPIYQFICDDCDDEFEEIQKMSTIEESNHLLIKCPSCESLNTHREISPCGWELKGEGWFNPHAPKKRARGGCPKK